MCGIVGYIGDREVIPILMDSLKRLEYRGYDSAGVAVLHDSKVYESKSVGKLINLEQQLKESPVRGTIGVGHTRWATHGRPSDINAHPHSDCKGELAVIHNGIIENYLTLKSWLISKGHNFRSQTDTEVIAHLIEEFYHDCSLEEATRKALEKIEGSYAIVVISSKEKDKIVAARKDSPLVIGLGRNENFLASDIPAFLPYTRKALIIEDNEIITVSKESVQITKQDGEEVFRVPMEIFWDAKMAEKGGYKHFMLKEIHEQPKVIQDTLNGRLSDDLKRVEFKDEDDESRNLDLTAIDNITIIACGTAYHAGLVGKYAFEKIAHLPTTAEFSSEFRYKEPLVTARTLVIAVSQSGETADTIAAIREAKTRGAKVLAITNVVGSSITREADFVFYIRAGLEVSVAATKSFVSQIIAFYLLALYFAQVKKTISEEEEEAFIRDLLELPAQVDEVLQHHDLLKRSAKKISKARNAIFIGRNINFPVALEGALKLKEISYIHAEGYAAGELKHGPIALIDENVPVIAIVTKSYAYEKTLSNLMETKAREAQTLAIGSAKDKELKKYASQIDYIYYIPSASVYSSVILTSVALQLLAYYTADHKGCDVDQPRNLAKSVTVE